MVLDCARCRTRPRCVRDPNARRRQPRALKGFRGSRRDVGIVRGHVTRLSHAHCRRGRCAAASPRLQRLLLSAGALLAALESPAADSSGARTRTAAGQGHAPGACTRG